MSEQLNDLESSQLQAFIGKTVLDLVSKHKVYVVFCRPNENVPLIPGDLHPTQMRVDMACVRYGSELTFDDGAQTSPRMVIIAVCNEDPFSHEQLLHQAYALAHERGHVVTYKDVKLNGKWLDGVDNESQALQSGIDCLFDNLSAKLARKVLESQYDGYKKHMGYYSGLCKLHDKLKELDNEPTTDG